MNKELFVSSTPHETKVGLVEDDLLAEVYLERENEYTLAGSIYKGRVTRVLPGMQSAFVDIGLERDAFLYVSDFMELEEHDDDLTDVVPATRNVPDLRQQPARSESAPGVIEASQAADGVETDLQSESDQEFVETESQGDAPPTVSAGAMPEPSGDSQNRERGGYRGRRRRRGGRRDGRGDGRDRGSDRGPERTPDRTFDRGSDRGPEQRFARPVEPTPTRAVESGRTQQSGPPPGYQPILLPGESISKYQRFAQQSPDPEPVRQPIAAVESEAPAESVAPLASTFPEDEPIFAANESVAEPLHEQHEDIHAVHEEPVEHVEAASTSTDWNQEFRRPEAASLPSLGWPGESTLTVEPDPVQQGEVEEEVHEPESQQAAAVIEQVDAPVRSRREEETPVFAAPGTMEEETIDEEEAGTIHYEASSDEGYDEFEEETQAGPGHLNGDARETVSEIHHASLTERRASRGSDSCRRRRRQRGTGTRRGPGRSGSHARRGSARQRHRRCPRGGSCSGGNRRLHTAHAASASRPGPGPWSARPATPWRRWWRTPFPSPRECSRSPHQRPAERRPGNSGADCQGTHRQERRAHYQPHRSARDGSWSTCPL